MSADHVVRLASPEDAPQVAQIYEPYVRSTPASFELEPPGAPEMRRRIEDILRTYPWVVAEAGERLLGYGYAGPFRTRPAYHFSVEVSVYVRDECRGLGIGRALTAHLLECVAAEGFANAFAGITLPNPPSVAMFESFGFEPVGVFRNAGRKFDAWHDVGWWQLSLATDT